MNLSRSRYREVVGVFKNVMHLRVPQTVGDILTGIRIMAF